MKTRVSLLNGNCLELMRKLEDSSIDLIFCDPPYNLSSEIIIRPDGKPDLKKAKDFMSKWIGLDAEFLEDWYKEAFRVLKHGGHCAMFGIDRQTFLFQYYAVLNGFQPKQSLYWYFISNFPKSSSLANNLYKKIDKKAILFQNIDTCLLSNNVKIAEILYPKKRQEAGIHTNKKEPVQENVSTNLESKKVLTQDTNLIVQIVDWKLNDTKSLAEVKLNIVVENVKQNIIQQLSNVATAENLLQDQHQVVKVKSYTVQKSVQIKLLEKIMDKIKAGEAQKTLNGKDKYWRQKDLNVLCAEILKDLRHTILNHVLNTLNCDMIQITDSVSATIAITTKSIMGDLITSTANMLEFLLEEKQINSKYKNYRYSISPLKQTCEEIMVFQKPYKHGSCLNDVLAYEQGDETITVGALDIEGNRVGVGAILEKKEYIPNNKNNVYGNNLGGGDWNNTNGRYPAQTFISSETAEVLDFQSGISKEGNGKIGGQNIEKHNKMTNNFGGNKTVSRYPGVGGCSRILHKCDYEEQDFDLMVYCPKVSKSERNEGCEGLEEKLFSMSGGGINAIKNGKEEYGQSGQVGFDKVSKKANNHPTVKPTKLLTHILKLFKTPSQQTILDPFMGSGSMGISAVECGYDYIGYELDPEYFKIATTRIENAKIKNSNRLL